MTDPAVDPIEARLRTALVDHYDVQQKLGEGGMALVYLARDLKHDRLVAIKVLRPDLAASIGADRFLKEIRHTAKLSHPHILPLYDSGEADSLLYYVMPFVEGESLSDLVRREKQLSISEAVKITREVAEALSHAHSYGLIHRDIKPDNILLSGGHAIVADFGISKALSEAGGEQLTQTGTSVGTPAYMSPEQAMGSPDLDGRSDVYSLGCVFYQLLVGDIPFTGPTPQAIMARHTMDQLTPPSIMRDTIPAELEEIIYTAMAKTPADRFRTAQEFVEALQAYERGSLPGMRASAVHQRLSAAQRMSGVQTMPTAAHTPQTPVPSLPSTPSVQPAWRRAVVPAGVVLGVVALGVVALQLVRGRSGPGAADAGTMGGLDPRQVAVLYFEDLSSDGAWGHVADGLTEGLIQKLAAVRGLSVVSRNGVEPYRGTDVTRDSIARALAAGSLVSGSVEPAGGRLRIVARLVDGQSGADIERASLELPAGELLVALDSVTETVSGFLRQRLGEEVRVRERRAATASVEAWGLVQRAERLRKHALEVRGEDPQAAWRAFQTADSLAVLAEQADAKWPEAKTLRGWIAYYRASLAEEEHELASEIEEAIRHANQAIALDPRAADALHLRGRARYRLWLMDVRTDPAGQARLLDSAQVDLEAAVAADPTLANAWYALSVLSYDREDRFAAVRAAERAYEADAFLSSHNNSLYQLFQTYYDLEQFPKAQQWCDEGARRFSQESRFTLCRLMMLITPWTQPDVTRAWSLARSLDTLAEPLDARIGRMFVGGVLARAGLADSARNVLTAARAGRDIDPDQELAAREAVMRVLLGDQDQAVEQLTRYLVGNPTHSFDLRSGDLHWWWRPLREHPRFKALAAERH